MCIRWAWDECPQDIHKIEKGVCGCGVPDDANGDGIPDCKSFEHIVQSWVVGGSVLAAGVVLAPWVIWLSKRCWNDRKKYFCGRARETTDTCTHVLRTETRIRYGLLAIGFVGTLGGEFALSFMKIFAGIADTAATVVSFFWILFNFDDPVIKALYGIFTAIGLSIQIVNTGLRWRVWFGGGECNKGN